MTWPFVHPTELWPGAPKKLSTLVIHARTNFLRLTARTHAKQCGCWSSKSEREREWTASTWTNYTPLIERRERKGCWKMCPMHEGLERRRDVCLYLETDSGKHNTRIMETRPWWLSTERSRCCIRAWEGSLCQWPCLLPLSGWEEVCRQARPAVTQRHGRQTEREGLRHKCTGYILHTVHGMILLILLNTCVFFLYI